MPEATARSLSGVSETGTRTEFSRALSHFFICLHLVLWRGTARNKHPEVLPAFTFLHGKLALTVPEGELATLFSTFCVAGPICRRSGSLYCAWLRTPCLCQSQSETETEYSNHACVRFLFTFTYYKILRSEPEATVLTDPGIYSASFFSFLSCIRKQFLGNILSGAMDSTTNLILTITATHTI